MSCSKKMFNYTPGSVFKELRPALTCLVKKEDHGEQYFKKV